MSSSIEIENVLRHNKTFKGCYAHDNLPTITKFPCSLIINTDNHDRPGDHWVGLVLNKKKCFYFDSYGAPVLSTHILLFLCDKYKEIVFSTKQVHIHYVAALINIQDSSWMLCLLSRHVFKSGLLLYVPSSPKCLP